LLGQPEAPPQTPMGGAETAGLPVSKPTPSRRLGSTLATRV
jgi:hypothetical protein